MNIRLTVLPLVFVLLGVSTSAAQSHGSHSHHGKNSYNHESNVIQMLKEEAAAVKKKGKDILIGTAPGPIPSTIPGDDRWSGLFQATRLDNPFITEQCRRQALRNAQDAIGGVEQALDHAEPHFEEWKDVLRGEKKISLAEYLDHVLNCKDFCTPLIGSLLRCHIEGIQTSDPDSMIITFGVGIPRAYGDFEFSQIEREQIANFARNMKAKRKKIILEARASILDTNEELRTNLELSQRRGSLMRNALINAGFPADDILVKSLCWEPPRLSIEEVAAAYGFASLRNRLHSPQYMDQSVVLLGY